MRRGDASKGAPLVPQAHLKNATPATARGTSPGPIALIPERASLAWERLKRAVRDHCTHPGQRPLTFRAYGGSIEFRSTEDGPLITFFHEDNRISTCMGGAMETILIVRLKTGGMGFEFLGRCHSATRLVIELACQAREIAAN